MVIGITILDTDRIKCRPSMLQQPADRPVLLCRLYVLAGQNPFLSVSSLSPIQGVISSLVREYPPRRPNWVFPYLDADIPADEPHGNQG
jgi:hypothetical protein